MSSAQRVGGDAERGCCTIDVEVLAQNPAVRFWMSDTDTATKRAWAVQKNSVRQLDPRASRRAATPAKRTRSSRHATPITITKTAVGSRSAARTVLSNVVPAGVARV